MHHLCSCLMLRTVEQKFMLCQIYFCCYCGYYNNVAIIFTILRAGEIHLGRIIKNHFLNLPLCEWKVW